MKGTALGILFGLILILCVFGFNWWLGGIEVHYLVSFWATYLQKKPVDCPMLPCHVAGIFFAEGAIPFVLVTWVLSFVIQ